MSVIVVVDPHLLTRLGLVQLMSDITPTHKIVGADYEDMEQRETPAGPIELVLLTVHDFADVYDLVANALSAYSPTAIMLTANDEEMPDLLASLPGRVKGYVSRYATPQILKAAVGLVLTGGDCFPRIRTATQLSQPRDNASSPHGSSRLRAKNPKAVPKAHSSLRKKNVVEADRELLGLTVRQYEVLSLLARGDSMKTIGRRLNISPSTAKAHLNAIYQRMGVHNRSAAIFAATNKGASLSLPQIPVEEK